MFALKNIATGLSLGIVLALGTIAPAIADDSEIYLSTAPAAGVRPNVLLLVDTSRSMDAADSNGERQPEYDPNGSGSQYTNLNRCTSGRIFFRRKGEPVPDCASTDYIVDTNNNCNKLALATATGSSGGRSGRWTGKAARFDAATTAWTDLVSGGSDAVECSADSGVHGANSAPSPNVYARNGSSGTKWTSTLAGSISWSARTTYTFYSWKYLNWYWNTPATSTVRRIQAVENAVSNLVSSVDDINMGMMRFNRDNGNTSLSTEDRYRGGVITNVIQNVETARAGLITAITNGGAGSAKDTAGYSPNSGTMLSETLWEAHQYWTGGQVWSGDTAGKDPSIPSAGGNYTSPINNQCQKNFQIILTDGRPTVDSQADGFIEGVAGACTGAPGDVGGGGETADGRCLDELAGYMHDPDTDLIPDARLAGDQQVTTYTIGFGQDVAGADFLDEVAEDGGGRRFDATNSSQLADIFDEIAADVLDVSSTFSTASVSVNAFNRTASREELYFALFKPADRVRWDGNLKKYKLAVVDPDGPTGTRIPEFVIAGQGTPPTNAIETVGDGAGFFKIGTQSFWSTINDGNDVKAGGAASKLPLYTSRVIKTHLGTNPLTLITNAAVTDTMLGASGATERAAVLDFMRAKDEKRMGDPMHSVPQVVTYGGTSAAPIDVVYVATNDGLLHAIDARNSSGVEKWAFIPQELLSRQKQLMDNAAITNRTYGLDGDVRILRFDINADGIIDATAGDHVYLYVGMRRGGRYYYALDVTDRDNPTLLWKLGPTQLPGIGETWSPPTIARVVVGGAAQNGQKFVLIFGGGYDAAQEGYAQVTDTMGNRVFMVDAKSGTLLWRAGKAVTGDTPNLDLAAMTNSIPGRITVLDLDGDQLADRMYAADTGGRVFRFDITNGNAAGTLVTGGVFAALGQGAATGGSVTSPDIAETRRFYNAPDVSLIQARGAAPYLSVAIGSGYRGHPLHRATTETFYALRDKSPFRRYTNTQYTDGTVHIITHNDPALINITADPATAIVPSTAVGWKYMFTARAGEKVLADATTAAGVTLFSTYQPGDPDPDSPCRSQHLNRTYAINIGDGHPAFGTLFEQVDHDGILGSVNIAVMRGSILDDLRAACDANAGGCVDVNGDGRGDATDPAGTGCASTGGCTNSGSTGGGDSELVCIDGMTVLDRCVKPGDGGRSYWRKQADSGN